MLGATLVGVADGLPGDTVEPVVSFVDCWVDSSVDSWDISELSWVFSIVPSMVTSDVGISVGNEGKEPNEGSKASIWVDW